MILEHTIGIACGSFAITNIDDIFVLTTFFAEASTSQTLTALKIALGQYLGFTLILIVSLIGIGVSLLLPSEPIGFLGWLPILIGISRLVDNFLEKKENGDIQGGRDQRMEGRGDRRAGDVLKVLAVTVMNGGDNVATYVPLFAQAELMEVVVYIVTFYILLGLWCVAAFLVMKQKCILTVVQRFACRVVPPLYIGLGTYIIAKSACYQWSIEKIDMSTGAHIGQGIMMANSIALVGVFVPNMILFKLRQRRKLARVTFQADNDSDTTEDRMAQNDSGSVVAADPDAKSVAIVQEVREEECNKGKMTA